MPHEERASCSSGALGLRDPGGRNRRSLEKRRAEATKAHEIAIFPFLVRESTKRRGVADAVAHRRRRSTPEHTPLTTYGALWAERR